MPTQNLLYSWATVALKCAEKIYRKIVGKCNEQWINSFMITYLKTTSPMKSDGACHCSVMLVFADGDVCVTVFSYPPQLINFWSRSDEGAKRPTTWYGGFKFLACIMNPPNDSSGTCDRISMRNTWPWFTATLNGSTRNGGRDVAGGMPPPWNGNIEWHTDSGAPPGSVMLGSNINANRIRQIAVKWCIFVCVCVLCWKQKSISK